MNLRKNYFISEKTQIAPSSIHGVGRFAIEPLRKGEVIIEAGGERVEAADFKNRGESKISFLCLSDDTFLVTKGSQFNATHLNHSCCPNLEFLFPFWRAAMDILVGSELTTDYQTLGYPSGLFGVELNCQCNSETCRKRISL